MIQPEYNIEVIEKKRFQGIAHLKKRWYYLIYCKCCGIVIARQHKRVRANDFYKPLLCTCGSCNFLIDDYFLLEDIVRELGIFKEARTK